MAYKIKVTPKHEREAQIAKACESPMELSTFHEYQNASQKLPVVRLPIELLIYRMANGRTRTEQIKYIRQHKFTGDFFSAGQETRMRSQPSTIFWTVLPRRAPRRSPRSRPF